MADVNISKYRASVVRDGSKPASPGFVVSEGQDPVNPPGTNNYVPYTGATANVELGEFGLETGFVTLDTTPTNVPTEQGAIYWDDSRSTAALIMDGTLQHIGQDTFFYVKNSSAYTIPKGTCVRFAGTDGASGHLLILPFTANGAFPSSYFMGVTAEDIANGEFGQVMNFGELSGIDTTGYTAGALLYASSTVAGAFQTTAPLAPNNIVLVAAAVNSKVNGSIVVRPTYGSNINNDEGVKITAPTTGDLLQLQASGLWENKTLAQVIGSAYVPSTRTITINGTAFDLSANRSWTVGDVRTDGSYSNPSWITALAWSKITGTPTTLSGYGITDAVQTSRTITINGVTQDLSANRTFNVGTVTSVTATSPLFSSGGATPNITIQQASGSQSGFLSSTDWTTFNNKQNALTNPVTGTGTTNYLAKFTGSTTIGNSQVFDNGTNVGIGTATPIDKLDVIGVFRSLMPSDPISGTITAKILSFSSNPYGIHFRGYDTGLHTIQSQREGNNLALFPLGLQPLGGNLLVGTTTDNGARLQVSGSATISTSVGINTTSPSAPLHIVTPTGVNFQNAIRFEKAGGFGEVNLENYYTSGSNYGFGIDVAGTTMMVVNNLGNFGIGSTSPGVRLVNSGATLASLPTLGAGTIGANAILSANGLYGLYTGVSSEGHVWQQVQRNDANSAVYPLVLQPSGSNVLIGTTTDNGAKLQVSGRINAAGGGSNGVLVSSNSGSVTIPTTGLSLSTGFNVGYLQNFNAGNYVDLYYGASRHIFDGGNVLIGTTTDNGAKLNVNGTIRTANPTGSTSDGWLLGRALVSGSSTPDRWIRVQIGNLYYDILAVYQGSV